MCKQDKVFFRKKLTFGKKFKKTPAEFSPVFSEIIYIDYHHRNLPGRSP